MTMASRSLPFQKFNGRGGSDETMQPNLWQSSGIWSGNGVIGGSLPPKRESSGTKLSDGAPPTAALGSAQLNHLSEAEPWGPRTSVWNSQDGIPQSRQSSGSASPTRTRDSVASHGLQDVFPTRPSLGTSTSSFTARPTNGSLDPSSSAFKFDSGSYNPLSGSHFSHEVPPSYKRGSQVPGSQGGMSSPRYTENESSNMYGDGSGFPFGANAPNGSSHQSQRAGHSQSTSFPSNPASRFSLGAADAERDLIERFHQQYSLGENDDTPQDVLASNAFPNASAQPFQFNPGTQPWSNDFGTTPRSFGQGYQPEAYPDALPSQSYGKSQRGSTGRGSPAGSSYRQSLNSPRPFAGTPVSRIDWNNSRPSSRDPRMVQDPERQSVPPQFLQQQQPNFFPNQFYNPTFATQYSTPYEVYNQNGFGRPAIPVVPYNGVPSNTYIGNNAPVPVRPSKDQDPGKGVRSLLLEEFRASPRSTKRYELKDIYNHIVEFSGDQHGSRFIQEKLVTANSDEKDQVFREIEPNALQLMKDVFGNYVIQKFFEHGNQVQKKIIAAQMKGKVAELSTQMYACRVVQKALEHVLVEQQAEIVEELRPDIAKIVQDQNGNHVVQKIIQMVPRLCIPFIMDAFRDNIRALAIHSYGCRVIQRILEEGTEEERTELMRELQGCSPSLITDQYGNYVTQHIIEKGSPEDRSLMINLVINQLLTFSKHKFASNVVEKCIEFGSPEERKLIREKLTTLQNDGTSPLQGLIKDQFGNYVIQKLLQHLEGSERDLFIEEVKPQLMTLKRVSTGRQITALDRLVDAVGSPRQGQKSNANILGTTASALHVDIGSAAPTPGLTMEQNSPESSSPPSTNNGSMEEPVGDNDNKAKPPAVNGAVVQISES